MNAIALDIGSGRCKIAYVDAAGKPNIIPNARGDLFTPSVVYYGKDGQTQVGVEAIERGFLDPEGAVWYPKPSLGTTQNLLRNGRKATATDAVFELVKRLVADGERLLSIKITKVLATCPADFNDAQKQALEEAFDRAGLSVLRFVAEPTAAGFAYAHGLQGGDYRIGVYDFGAGTFDFSILEVSGSLAKVLATEGVKRLGGIDINECIQRRVLDAIEAEHGDRPTPEDQPLLFLDLSIRTEQAKLSLSTQTTVPIIASFDGKQTIVEITQEEFHEDIDPLIDQSLDCIDRTLKAAGLTFTDLDRLVLVGGSSRLRRVQERVADHTGLVPRTDIDPDKAVPFGGAMYSVVALREDGEEPKHGGSVIPAPGLFAQDVTAHAVGCAVVDSSSSQQRLIQAVIVAKNTPIPCKGVDCFFLQHDDQEEARIEILQGNAEDDRDDCLLIGELVLDNLPSESLRTKRIKVDYLVDANGMVTATATDKVSGQQQTVSVDYKKGIKPKPKPMAA